MEGFERVLGVSERTRWAFVVCPVCGGSGKQVLLTSYTNLNPEFESCQPCLGEGKLKAQLIRVAPGSAARGGMSKMKRDSADIKFSKAVRDRDGWKCSVCHKDFRDRPGMLDTMHLVKRRYRALRKGYAAHTGDGCCLKHDMGNALAGCRSCHMRLEGKPENEQHFRDVFGDSHVDALLGEKPKSEKVLPRRTA